MIQLKHDKKNKKTELKKKCMEVDRKEKRNIDEDAFKGRRAAEKAISRNTKININEDAFKAIRTA